MHGRMLGDDERTNADKHDKSREYDAFLIGDEYSSPIAIILDQAFGDEDCIVVALSKDEGGKDDIDDIETYSPQIHQS